MGIAMHRVIVCGGRTFDAWEPLCNALNDLAREIGPFVVIEGGAKGADFLGRVWARHMRYKIETFPADWRQHGKSAGYIRNREMAQVGRASMVMAFPGGDGTKNMVEIARNYGIPVRFGMTTEDWLKWLEDHPL